MSLASLLTVLLPPPQPVEVPTTEDWRAIESLLGELPADYKAFVERFGTGKINEFILVLNPASKNPYLNLVREMEPILSALRELIQSGEPCPFPLHPESGGLLPFGKTDNGDALFWLTQGEPDKWHVVVNSARDATYERFECDATDFLAGILTRQLRCAVFHESFPTGPAEFAAVSPRQ
ncbi:MAG TPA: SMI1/KNR4 family protein [Verrucomicrobiota bacterium]|nr:SMI1/KNR4 family protein [Verrucomicrobiota bacterium]HOX63403.1 SMI1/KNR4 family protein [Verrucomicrobiota bacterium]HPI66203.1 SMI1/KNR4 family protein [Verrucomicrobiota bacterium]HPW92707.1 SMI1/KNR4 family protein [Verrucomicrobiota bacterium]